MAKKSIERNDDQGPFRVTGFSNNGKKKEGFIGEFPTLAEAKEAGRKWLGVKSLDQTPRWHGDSLNDYNLGFADDWQDSNFFEIWSAAWAKEAAADRAR